MKTSLPMVVAAGLFNSRLSFSHMTVSAERAVRCYEIEYFSETGGVSHLNGVSYPIRPGNVIIARPGDRRFSELHFTCRYIHLVDVDGSVARLVDELPRFLQIPADRRDEEVFDRISDAFTSQTPYREAVMAAETILWLQKLHTLAAESAGIKNNVDGILRFSQRMIEEHYAENLSVERLAEHCSVSVSYLHRLYASELQTSPHAAILNYRLTQAKQMLRDTVEPLSVIARRCGFRSDSYFSDCFRRCVGVSPVQFRRSGIHQP